MDVYWSLRDILQGEREWIGVTIGKIFVLVYFMFQGILISLGCIHFLSKLIILVEWVFNLTVPLHRISTVHEYLNKSMLFVKDLSKYTPSTNVCIIICHLMVDRPYHLCHLMLYFSTLMT